MRISLAISTLGALVTAVGCNAFDPDLGTTPFKCNPTEPRCPDDYTCSETSPGVELCVASGADPSALPDGGGDPNAFNCSDDSSIEVNNTISTATQTEIDTQPRARLVGLAICPASDVDIFAITVSPGGADIKATVETGTGPAELQLTMLNSEGAGVGDGAPDPMNPGDIVIQRNNTPQGIYYFEVAGDGLGENNFNIEIEATAP